MDQSDQNDPLATLLATTVYRSGNGDVWTLVHDPATCRTTVQHRPGPMSAEAPSEVGIETLLASSRHDLAWPVVREEPRQVDA